MDNGQEERRPSGRPTILSGQPKRYPVGIRTTKRIKDLLQGAADSSGRSLAQEIEFRLERSFEIERVFGGPKTEKVLRQIAALMPNDDEWTDLWASRRAVFRLLTRVIEESPPRLALDVINFKKTKGIEAAKLLAIAYYSGVREEFSKSDQREYCQFIKEIVGLSPEQLANGEGRVGS